MQYSIEPLPSLKWPILMYIIYMMYLTLYNTTCHPSYRGVYYPTILYSLLYLPIYCCMVLATLLKSQFYPLLVNQIYCYIYKIRLRLPVLLVVTSNVADLVYSKLNAGKSRRDSSESRKLLKKYSLGRINHSETSRFE